jgi:hypothetical protein
MAEICSGPSGSGGDGHREEAAPREGAYGWDSVALSSHEIEVWLHDLAPHNHGRLTVLEDMWRHRSGDDMTRYDRQIVAEALKRLREAVCVAHIA